MSELVVLMNNSYKLVLVILGFFLALTYVHGLDATADSVVVFNGKNPASYLLTITNHSNTGVSPEFFADGPFSIERAEKAVVPSQSEEVVELILSPDKKLEINDSYQAQIRITSLEGTAVHRITLKQEAEKIDFGKEFESSISGLFIFTQGNEEIILNAVLLMIVIVLFISLAARIKNRV
jgi:hypothetical protein